MHPDPMNVTGNSSLISAKGHNCKSLISSYILKIKYPEQDLEMCMFYQISQSVYFSISEHLLSLGCLLQLPKPISASFL